VLTTP
jgi:hypothetical protein